MKTLSTVWAMAAVALLPTATRAEVSAEVAATPEYKKCMLQKELAENRDAVKAVNGMLQNNHEEAKVVGYVSLGNQSNMNQNKMFINQAKKEAARISKDLQKFSKIKVDCKAFESKIRASAQEKCLNNPDAMIKLNATECQEMIERDPTLTLWKR